MNAPLNPTQERLVARIEQVFTGVVLGDGVGLREADALDDYGDTKAARLKDETLDWHKLLDDEEFHRMTWALSFFDAEGMRFHLPAYLTVAVKDPEAELVDSLIHSLCRKLRGGPMAPDTEYFRLLDTAQVEVVLDVLKYLRDSACRSYSYKELARAIDRYWSSQQNNPGSA